MSSVQRDMVEGYEEIAKEIQDFLWEGKPEKSPKKERTKEELEEFLEGLRTECWDNYNTGARSLGWDR
ncbi:hypothetical protein CVD28_02755 [Bacillus sp. M6-12]|uniref:hypothetical protein n=1 Tax=Bacillus sp. M6-12 TaxID=2054166 RepID=UPI000C77B189|nr:hypothetical protein [Bacillus sp. M6-12]PLS19352.1 hypothetical protein CVD28_02755 [Bacillus sp. M6-12]